MRTGPKAAFLAALLTTVAWCSAIPGQAQTEKKQPDKKGARKEKSRDDVIEGAVGFLKSAQAEDGTWSKAANAGVTGVVLNGLLRSGKVGPDDPVAAKALKVIESMADMDEGHLAGGGERIFQKNYITSVNVMALKASGQDKKYEAAIARATEFLKKGQIDGGEDKKRADPAYGGFGYAAGTRADLSNTHFVLDALTAAGVSRDDPVFKKAAVYVSRMQHFQSEFNDQPWAGKLNDGSFIYVAGSGPGGGSASEGPRPGYGSMTYAGLVSLAQCGVPKDDRRCQKALEWIAKHYSVDLNPGLQEGTGGRGYYYYLVVMAKCLDQLGLDELTDADGKKHDWRADITRALASRQRRDGSWGNEFTTWLEGDPNLCTGYALIALSHCKPKAK